LILLITHSTFFEQLALWSIFSLQNAVVVTHYQTVTIQLSTSHPDRN